MWVEGRVIGRVPGRGDLVCYWFEKALAQIAAGQLQVAGLVSTKSIRCGANRKMLERISETSRIFLAWSDESWVNDGAAVRVSMVGFGQRDGARLEGVDVPLIPSYLTAAAGMDLTQSQRLGENCNASFQGASKKAKFEVDEALACNGSNYPIPMVGPIAMCSNLGPTALRSCAIIA